MLFAYHWLLKVDSERWERLGSHLGTQWTREGLEALNSATGGVKGRNPNIFVPLSLVVNPELPAALLGKKPDSTPGAPSPGPSRSGGDGLRTDMPLPKDTEVVNMSELDRDEFFGLLANAGLSN